MIKAVGAVMVLIACTGMGIRKGMEYKMRIQDLVSLKKILLLLRGEIKYAATPLSIAFFQIGERMESIFGTFFQKVGQDIESQKGSRFSEIWKAQIQQQLGETSLQGSDKELLGKLGDYLGYLDRDTQITQLDCCVDQIEELLKQLEQDKNKKMKICGCLGIFAGIMLNLILL